MNQRATRKRESISVCTWCHVAIGHMSRALTLPEFTRYGASGWPKAIGVRVCGPGCPKRPENAPVGSHFANAA